MLKLAIAGTVLLAIAAVASAEAPQASRPVAKNGRTPPKTVVAPAREDVRGRVVDIQQALDRILADTTPAPVGTSGATTASGTAAPTATSTAVTVDRARLLQLRRQLDALLATVNKTP